MLTPMIEEPFFSIPVDATPTVQDAVVQASIVSSSVVATNENEEPILQDLIEPIAADEGEQQQPQLEEVPVIEGPRRSQRVRKPAIFQ